MTTFEIIRLLLAVALIAYLIFRRGGFRKYLRELRDRQQKEAALKEQAEQKREAKRKALEAREEKARRTSQILKLGVQGLKHKSATAAGLKIRYLEGGAAHPGATVLLLHGFAGQKEDWNAFAQPLLENNLHVVAPDLPGFGENLKNPDANYEVTTQAKRIRAFAKALELERFHLVGSSLGGAIAAAYAYGASDQVLSLTLIEPFGVRVPYESELDKYLARGVNPLTVATPEAYGNLLSFLFETPPAVPEALRQHQAEEAAAHRGFYLKMWPQIRGGERAHLLDLLLPELNKKTLAIQGEKSKVVHPATAQIVTDMVRGSSAVTIAGCGHLPAVEKPQETAQHFLRFLQGVPAAGAPAGGPAAGEPPERPSSAT